MTLLAHLTGKMSHQAENLATEALAYLLGANVDARRVVAQRISAALVEDAGRWWVHTQVAGAGGARPDLVATVDGAPRVRFEVKFYAGLTANQPVGYLGDLPVGGALVFLVPAVRREAVWGELVRRVGAAGLPLSPRGACEADVGGRHLSILTWDAVLDALDRVAERGLRDDVRQLRGLVDAVCSLAFLPLSAEELTTTSYGRVPRLGVVLDRVVTGLPEDLLVRRGFKAAAANGWYGRWGRMGDVSVLIHVNTWLWGATAPTPFWCTTFVHDGAVAALLDAWHAAHPGFAHRSHHRPARPLLGLPVAAGETEDELVARLTGLLGEVATLVRGIGGAEVVEEEVAAFPTDTDPSRGAP